MQDHNPRKSEQETNGTGSPMSALDRLMLDDTPIPDVFITDYMPELSEQAVKVYLHVSLASTRTRKPIRIKDLSARLNILLPKLEDTLADLLKAGLVQIQDEHVRLTDLKKRAVETIFRAKMDSPASPPVWVKMKSQNDNVLLHRLTRPFSKG